MIQRRHLEPLPAVLLAAALGAACMPGAALALSSDRNQPTYIEADHADLNNKTGVSIYTGNVRISRGSMHMTGDTMTVYSQGDKVTKLIAVGAPATYRQRPDHKDKDVEAKAQRIEYYVDQDRVVLIDQAQVWQAGNVFRSNHIVYDIARDVVNAGTGTAGGGDKQRVHIILQPKTAPAPAK